MKLDRGAAAGYSVGVSLACFDTGPEPAASVSGYRGDALAGHVTVVEVQPTVTIALVGATDAQPKPGDTCRREITTSDASADSQVPRPVEPPKKRRTPMLAPNF